jgi:hypothetical protein
MSRFSLTSGRRCGFAGRARNARKQANHNARVPAYLRPLRFEPMEERTLLSACAAIGPMTLPSAGAVIGPMTLPSAGAVIGPMTLPSAGAVIGPMTLPSAGTLATANLPLALLSNLIPPATCDHIAIPVRGGGSGNAPMFQQQGMSPSQVRTAYGLDPPITINGVTGDGTGQTIAIVDAYQNTHIISDLAAFDSNFGLAPPPNFLVLNQSGGTDLSGVPDGAQQAGDWPMEIALDVEWAHVIAPNANIVLFEANSNVTDLYTAVNEARTYTNAGFCPNGVSVVSMSWGAAEGTFGTSLAEAAYKSYFQTTSSGHTGVTFVASTGDNGAPTEFPACSPNVLAIGGTTLDIADSSGTYNTELGWSGSGGGPSSYFSKPSYQNSFNTSSSRQTPDVSFDASDLSNVLVYDAGWYDVWGTSLAAPCWAGLIAIANQFRTNASLGTLNPYGSPTQAQSLLYGYAGSSSNFNPLGLYHDILTGTSTGSPNYSCAAGYDMVTGIGSPVANLLAPALAYAPTPGTPDLVATYDHGQSDHDNITNLNNHNSGAELQFTVSNTVSGATVTLYADGTAIGSATATGASTTITTTGSFTLTDGTHAITAKQSGVANVATSLASSALSVTIDTTPPTVTVNQGVGQADPTSTSPIAFSAVFSENVWDFATGDVTLSGTAGATSAVVSSSGGSQSSYIVNVSGMAGPGTVIVSVAAGVAHDTAGNANLASTSTDNTVTYQGPPVATVSLNNHTPLTNSTLVATATKSDPGGNPVTLTFVWTVNGTVRRTFTSATALSDAFNLSLAGNGNRGDTVVVSVTPNDGFLNGAVVTDTAIVADTAPVARVSLNNYTPRTNDILTASAAKSDADGDPVSLTYVWKVNGIIKQTDVSATAMTDTFNLSLPGNGDPGDVIRVEVTPNDGTLNGTTVSDTATVVDKTRTWDGGGGADNNWMTAANWANNVVPVAGDSLVFTGAAPTSTNNNFSAGTIFDSITFAAGSFTLSGNSVKLTPAGGVAITANASGQDKIDLPIAAGSTGTMVVLNGTLELGPNAQALVLSGSGADIQGGKLVFDYNGSSSPAATIESLLTASYHGGLWNVGQFKDSTEATTGLTLGWADDGTSAVTVMATIPGDFNLDGVVNQNDLDILSVGFGIGTTWAAGDANYDGVLNLGDLDIVMANMGAVLPSSAVQNGAAASLPATASALAGQTAAQPSAIATSSVGTGNSAAQRVDLLTGVMYEMGRPLGYGCSGTLAPMHPTLYSSGSQLTNPAAFDQVFASY